MNLNNPEESLVYHIFWLTSKSAKRQNRTQGSTEDLSFHSWTLSLHQYIYFPLEG